MTQSRGRVVVRALRRGQVTIPARFRNQLGIDDDSILELTLAEDRIEIRPLVAKPAAGSGWVRELYERFAPIRAGAEELPEDEIDHAIDDAVNEVRARRDG
jgi:AbrB family looped-hinge helix DNA binding protein